MKPELPKPLSKLIENTIDELSMSTGKTFNDIWYLVFSPISYAADKRRAKFEHNLSVFKQELAASISKIPEDKQIEPSLQVTAQALENSKYCIEENELRQMFASLISHSMNSDLHPKSIHLLQK